MAHPQVISEQYWAFDLQYGLLLVDVLPKRTELNENNDSFYYTVFAQGDDAYQVKTLLKNLDSVSPKLKSGIISSVLGEYFNPGDLMSTTELKELNIELPFRPHLKLVK